MKTSEKKESWHNAIFAAKAEIVVSTKDGPEPALKEVNFNLIIPDQDTWLDKKSYLANDQPTPAGVKVLTNIFVQALVGNIKAAHASGAWNEKQHFEFVCFELGRAMAANSEVSTKENHFRSNGDQLIELSTEEGVKTQKVSRFKTLKFPTPAEAENWLKQTTAKIISLKDQGQDLQKLWIHESGEILDTDFNQEIYIGKFVNMANLTPDECLETWNNETGGWDFYQKLVIEKIN